MRHEGPGKCTFHRWSIDFANGDGGAWVVFVVLLVRSGQESRAMQTEQEPYDAAEYLNTCNFSSALPGFFVDPSLSYLCDRQYCLPQRVHRNHRWGVWVARTLVPSSPPMREVTRQGGIGIIQTQHACQPQVPSTPRPASPKRVSSAALQVSGFITGKGRNEIVG